MSNRPRIEQIKFMLQKEPNDAFLNYALATEFVAINELDKAKKIFENLVQNQPEYVATYLHLGKLFEMEDDSTKAISVYESGIKIATKIKDLHAKSELQDALNEILYADD